jgi:hypothetical protein
MLEAVSKTNFSLTGELTGPPEASITIRRREMRNFQFVLIAANLFLALCKPTSSLLAQNSGHSWPDSSFLQRMEEIDQKQRILEQRWEIEQENAAARAKEAPILVAGKDGFSLTSADGSYLLRLRGHTQMDGRYFNADENRRGTNTFVVRRLRFVFEGTLAKFFDFKFMPDFAGSRLVLQDSISMPASGRN